MEDKVIETITYIKLVSKKVHLLTDSRNPYLKLAIKTCGQ